MTPKEMIESSLEDVVNDGKYKLVIPPERWDDFYNKTNVLQIHLKDRGKLRFTKDSYVIDMMTRFGKQQRVKGVWIGIVIGFLTSVGIQVLIFLSNAGII